MEAKPNILWICTDQQRYDTIHHLGNDHIHTANLDRLCKEGVSFTRAYSQCPVCQPSRASFLTGLYPSTIHVNRNGNESFPDRFKLITKRLAETGYDCGLAGKLHIASPWFGTEPRTDDGYRVFRLSHSPTQAIGKGNQYTDWLQTQVHDLGEVFEEFYVNHPNNRPGRYRPDLPVRFHQSVWCADRAIEFIEEPREGPWLMSVNPYDPHEPFDAPKAYADRYDPKKLAPHLFDERDLVNQGKLSFATVRTRYPKKDEDMAAAKASYYGMITLVDEQVGRMLEALGKTGQRENTIVIYTSDHGEMLGDHGLKTKGCRFNEGVVHVPLIISWPRRFEQDMTCNALVELTDLAPTLAELAGTTIDWTHGRSLVSILEGKSSGRDHREYVRSEFYDAVNLDAPHNSERHVPVFATMYFDGRYKLNVYHGHKMGELYDLQEDPDEFANLWEDAKSAALKMELLKRSFDASIVIHDPGTRQIGRY